MLCMGNYKEGDIVVEFYGQDRDEAIEQAKTMAKMFKYRELSRPEDPGWAAGDGEHSYVEVRAYDLANGRSFRDDNHRNDILFPNEKTQYENGQGSDL